MADTQTIIATAQNYYQCRDFSCCESILKAIKDGYGLAYDDEILKIATGMAGGIGGQGCLCGALSGSVMSLGLIYGRSTAKEDTANIKAYSAELYKHFEDNFCFFCCRTQIKDFVKGSAEQIAYCQNLIKVMTEKTCEIIEREGF